jgi:hypothetical protein
LAKDPRKGVFGFNPKPQKQNKNGLGLKPKTNQRRRISQQYGKFEVRTADLKGRGLQARSAEESLRMTT